LYLLLNKIVPEVRNDVDVGAVLNDRMVINWWVG